MSLIHFLKTHLITCSFKSHFGIPCLGCGFQNSLIHLLEGNLNVSLAAYPATIPILLLWIFVLLHLTFKFQFGASVIIVLFSLTSLIIFISYAVKLIKYI
jgi:Protein of unknown function (DUF2752)